jgi:phage host-nuclease inhibitor protein Gam
MATPHAILRAQQPQADVKTIVSKPWPDSTAAPLKAQQPQAFIKTISDWQNEWVRLHVSGSINPARAAKQVAVLLLEDIELPRAEDATPVLRFAEGIAWAVAAAWRQQPAEIDAETAARIADLEAEVARLNAELREPTADRGSSSASSSFTMRTEA